MRLALLLGPSVLALAIFAADMTPATAAAKGRHCGGEYADCLNRCNVMPSDTAPGGAKYQCLTECGFSYKDCVASGGVPKKNGTPPTLNHPPVGGVVPVPGGVKTPPKGKTPVGVGGVMAPNSGVKQSGGGNQPVTIERSTKH
jgi:hypothetical protein